MVDPPLDPRYFNDDPWWRRVDEHMASSGDPFLLASARLARAVVSDEDAGARVVVNVGTAGMLGLLRGEPYLNAYDRRLVGGEPGPGPDDRAYVDGLLGLGPEVCFAALAVDGVGVRLYGEYCLVLDVARVDPDPGLLDRDSYEVLFEPLVGRADLARVVGQLRGSWADRHDLLLLKVLPRIDPSPRRVTTAVVADAVLSDQDFVEVHLRPRRAWGCFELADVPEVRLSPTDLTLVDWLASRAAGGARLTDEELRYLTRHDDVQRRLDEERVAVRVIGGRGGGDLWT